MKPSVMIFTPTWRDPETHERAMHPACQASIAKQQGQFDGELLWVIGEENPYPIGDYRNVLHQFQFARDVFLDGPFDALLTVEHDNELPDGALQLLYDTPGDVIYAPYVLRHGMLQLSTWQYINDRNLGMSLSNYPHELARYKAAGVGRVSGVGNGCTLFRRHVLQRLPFREVGDGRNYCPDIPFAEDALREGFVSMARFDVPVGHWDNGRRLMPYEELPTVLYKATETCNAMADGQVLHLVAGEEYHLTPIQAADLIRAGYLQRQAQPETASIVPGGQQAVMPKATRRKRG